MYVYRLFSPTEGYAWRKKTNLTSPRGGLRQNSRTLAISMVVNIYKLLRNFDLDGSIVDLLQNGYGI